MPNVIAVLAILASAAQAAEPALVVRLVSGRVFAGSIDARTSSESLVLRSSYQGAVIRRPVRWERIVAATLDGQPLEIELLKTRAKELASEDAEAGSQRSEVGGQRSETELPVSDIRPPSSDLLPPVTAIGFDARIANWDADVETDGLILELLPVDAAGYLTAVSGTVEVELFAPQRRVFHHAPQSGGDTLELVERWTNSVRAADFTTAGVRLRLPFGAVHPEFDSDWLASHYGLVHVRLAAPGHGTFEASRDGLRIRPWAPNRDQLELNEGRRFVPSEGVGRRD